MATTTTMTEQEYLAFVLTDPDEKWELHDGKLVCKPPMTWEHMRTAALLGHDLQQQLGRGEYIVISEAGRLRRDERHYYVPDVIVVPVARARELFREPGQVGAFPVALPFVVEVWSPSTGDYDVKAKLPDYQQRGDLEVWFIHPYERTMIAWVRQPDGSYSETLHRGGVVRLAALPAAIDLDTLFEP
jgi:Uma2 family endonuclease